MKHSFLASSYYSVPRERLPEASVYALQGITRVKAETLLRVFNANTVSELAQIPSVGVARRIEGFLNAPLSIDERVWLTNVIEDAYQTDNIRLLLSSPVSALTSISSEHARELERVFGLTSIKKLARFKYSYRATVTLRLAARRAPNASPHAFSHEALTPALQNARPADLLKERLTAFRYVSKETAADIAQYTGLKTIRDFGTYAPFIRARTLLETATIPEECIEKNARYAILDPPYETYTIDEIITAPVTALKGVSAPNARALKRYLNIATIADLGSSPYFLIAERIYALSRYQSNEPGDDGAAPKKTRVPFRAFAIAIGVTLALIIALLIAVLLHLP